MIVVINKVDKSEARPFEVQDEVFELFAALSATDKQLEFPTIFASAKEGWAADEPDGERNNMTIVFRYIVQVRGCSGG